MNEIKVKTERTSVVDFYLNLRFSLYLDLLYLFPAYCPRPDPPDSEYISSDRSASSHPQE